VRTLAANHVLWTSRTQRGDSMSLNQRVAGDFTTQGTSTTLPPPLVLVQTPQPPPLVWNVYFRMVDRCKITVESRSVTSPSCCASMNPTRTFSTMMPSCMSGTDGVPNSRDGARAALGCERASVYTYPRPARSAGRRRGAIVCGALGRSFSGPCGGEWEQE